MCIFRNTDCDQAETGSFITISLTEEKMPGCPSVGSLSQWKYRKKKKLWNLFTSWLLCRSAIVILSLITSDAFCHLLVTNLHLADYQRSPNQWVIGVEDCGANPGNESTYKLIAWEESLLVTSVTSYMQRISATLTEYLPLGRTESEKDLSQAAGQIIPASVTIP